MTRLAFVTVMLGVTVGWSPQGTAPSFEAYSKFDFVPGEKVVLPAVLLYLIVSSIATLPYLRWSKGQVEHEHRPMMAVR